MKTETTIPEENDKSSDFLSWEREIQFLVYLASLVAFFLLMAQVSDFFFSSDYFYRILPFFLSLSLIIIFVIGLFFVYFQLRWINENRNKKTCFGGITGLTGLAVTLIPSIRVFFPNIFFLPDSFSNVLLILGLSLTVVGIYIETTRFDESIIYWIQANKLFTTQLLLFVLLLLSLVICAWEWDPSYQQKSWPLIIFLISYLLGMIIWWSNSSARRVAGSLLSAIAILLVILLSRYSVTFTNPNASVIWVFLVILGILGLTLLWFKEIVSFVQLICVTLWQLKIQFLRIIGTSIGVFLILAAFFSVFLSSLEYFVLFGCLGIVILYISWIPYTNELVLSASEWVKTHKRDVWRGVWTVSSILLIIYGLISLLGEKEGAERFFFIGLICLIIGWIDLLVVMTVIVYVFILTLITDLHKWICDNKSRTLSYFGSFLGSVLVLVGVILLFSGKDLGAIFVFLGLLILYISWFKWFNDLFITITQTLVASVIALLQCIKENIDLILRVLFTSVAVICFFIGCLFVLNWLVLEGLLLVLLALIIIYFCWPLWWQEVFESTKEVILIIAFWFKENFLAVLKALITIFSVLIIIIGLLIGVNGQLVEGIVVIAIGLSLLIICYQTMLKEFLTAIYDLFLQMLEQIQTILVTVYHISIIIILLSLSATIFLFGILLFLSGLIDPTGSWCAFMYALPPLDWIRIVVGGHGGTLIGVFSSSEPPIFFIQLLIGIGFTIVSIILLVLVILKQEALYLGQTGDEY